MAEDPNAQNNTGAAGTEGDVKQPPDKQTSGTLLGDEPKGGEKPKEGEEPKPGEGEDPKDGEKPKEGEEPKDGKEKKEEGAPEKYETFSAPEGVELDQEMLDEFSNVAKELNLSQENAQKLVDFGPKLLQKAQERQTQQWLEIREGWVKDLKADKEFGGEKFNETVERAKRALNTFGDEGLTKLLLPPEKGGTGFGDNDAIIKFLARVDKATSEDAIVDGGEPGKDNRGAADVLYPSQGKE